MTETADLTRVIQTRDIEPINEHDQAQEAVENGFTVIVWAFAIAMAGVLLVMLLVLAKDAMPSITREGLSFFWTRDWVINQDDPTLSEFGALPFIYGTIVTSFLALLFAIPLGVSVAVLTSEDMLPPEVKNPLAFMVEIIAAIPSVVIGLWGIKVLIPFMFPIQVGLFNSLRFLPIFGKETDGRSYLVAGVLLAIMIVPTIASISRDVLLAVPADLRSASMALGATRWETIWRVRLRTAFSGMVGSIVLALGRALGETIAVTMVIGNSKEIQASLLAAGYTIPAVLVNEFAEASAANHIGALMYLSLILFIITLVVNVLAEVLVQLFGVKMGR